MSDLFPFEYQGGGYFRAKGVPKNVVAEILHGEVAVEYAIRATFEACHAELVKNAEGSGWIPEGFAQPPTRLSD